MVVMRSFIATSGHCTVRCCEPFDSEQPHITSNKLRGMEIIELNKFELIVLIDCAMIIANDPSEFRTVDGVGLKLADAPTVKD